ncbi:hypothetical protein F444_16138 [Phytophthora nicotianae P1976]|uniref:Uncharacterized protein n=1 Tax=Phytophthora nicotianae P1976 TaxID=1317066 RepID=A0A080ZJG7_PHYNI|nr:hypothetical protein F444_16138 [Phytophthora nicotianae P1976]
MHGVHRLPAVRSIQTRTVAIARFVKDHLALLAEFKRLQQALRALEADNVFVSAVYRWFRWLRYHPAYGITSPDEEARHCALVESHDSAEEQEPGGQAQGGIELLGSTAEQVTSATTIDEPPAADETPISVGEHEKVTAFQLDELQACFRKQNKLHGFCVHTNAMGIAFMLDPSMVLDAFVGADDGQ